MDPNYYVGVHAASAPLYQEETGKLLPSNPKDFNPQGRYAKSISVKAKMGNRHTQFDLPLSSSHIDLVAHVKKAFHIQYEGGASVGTAYILWMLFGFLGVHRFYIRQHSATSFFIWFLTGQLFGLGWIYDGFTLHTAVQKYNENIVADDEKLRYNTDRNCLNTGICDSYKGNDQPSMVGAYLLWFFMGWFGAHRWYTGHHSASSFFVWLFTGQMCGFGWLYDGYYTYRMVHNYQPPSRRAPFHLKAHDGFDDYIPIQSNEELRVAMASVAERGEKVLRLVVSPKKSDMVAYTLWFFFGLVGAHAVYLDMDPSSYCARFFTGNYFFFGWIVDGINLDNIIEEANTQRAVEFIPSREGRRHWPMSPLAATIDDVAASIV